MMETAPQVTMREGKKIAGLDRARSMLDGTSKTRYDWTVRSQGLADMKALTTKKIDRTKE
jgi:hypothetical protein